MDLATYPCMADQAGGDSVEEDGISSATSIDRVHRTIQVYDRIVEDYTRRWYTNPVMEPTIDSFLEFVDRPGAILDIGCGPGRDVNAFQRRGFEALGIDLSSAMVKEARRRVPNAVFRQMDMRRLSFPPASFVGAWACSSLQHLPHTDALQTMNELSRVLAPEGMLMLSLERGQGERVDEWGRYQRRYTLPAIYELLEAFGFQPIEHFSSSSETEIDGRLQTKDWLQVIAGKESSRQDPLEEAGCPFCSSDRFRLNREIGLPASSSILWGDGDFYVIPDIAPLVEGHLLLISTNHYPSIGAIPSTLIDPLQRQKTAVRQLLQIAYGKPTMFLEHGSVRCGEAGSCISHAHLHCLPCELPIREVIEKMLGEGKHASIAELRGLFDEGQSYLYIEETTGNGCVYPERILPLQYLRQVFLQLTNDNEWRWQTACQQPERQTIYRHSLQHLLTFADDQWSALMEKT
jgi:ubiquinone/menaquinone biosynthesis C-methylase UbiE/diadenosine tetraphosphate (Ap4A) HIT family hydrolase